jgi:membrane associated rhomboid family serine protease
MSAVLNQIKSQFKSGSMNLKLIMVNVGVFLAFILASFFISLVIGVSVREIHEFIYSYTGASSNLSSLITTPWTLFTYMFSHDLGGLSHIFWNMLILFFAGNLFERTIGSKKLLSVYIVGGVFSFLLFFIVFNLSSILNAEKAFLVGASGSVMAILFAIGVYAPNYLVKIPFISQPFKLIHVVLFFFLIDFVKTQAGIGFENSNTGGGLAHIGGALFGFVYASQLKKGRNISKRFEKFLDTIFGFFKPGTKLKVKYPKKKKRNKKQKEQKTVPRDDYDYNNNKVENQKKTDSILDKISKSGYESLSKKEKDFLFRQSKH